MLGWGGPLSTNLGGTYLATTRPLLEALAFPIHAGCVATPRSATADYDVTRTACIINSPARRTACARRAANAVDRARRRCP